MFVTAEATLSEEAPGASSRLRVVVRAGLLSRKGFRDRGIVVVDLLRAADVGDDRCRA